MNVEQVAGRANDVLDEVERAVVGKREALELVLLGILADGHVLIEDFPGLAKTLMARAFAQVTSIGFTRVQFTPDLMPSDVTGASIYNQREADFEFRPGPIFTNLLLADEINRAPPKTQAALLEAMQERQVTIEGVTHPLAPPFLVLATQNPIEYEGTYPLPEAQLDRFLLRIGVGYPEREQEWDVLARRLERASDEVELEPVVGRDELLEMQQAIEQRARRAQRRALHGRPRRGDALGQRRPGRGEPARLAGAAEALALPRRARRPRLRDAGRREGGRRARARAPALAAAGALGAAAPAGRHRARAARPGADAGARAGARAGTRVTRAATTKLGAYAALAGLGLLAALVLGRPEPAALAAPFALLLVVGLSLAEPPRVGALFELEAERQVEGEPVEALLELRAENVVPRLELLFDLPRGLADRGAEPAAPAAPARRPSRARPTRSAASAGARTSSATSCSGRRTASACSSSSRSSSCRDR